MPRVLRRHTSVKLALIVCLVLLLMSLPSGWSRWLDSLRPTAQAATTFTVNSTGDGADSNVGDGVCNDGTGSCTLRAAAQEASAASGDDTINFSLAANSTITLNTPLGFNGNISIVGPGASLLTIQRSSAVGTPMFPVFGFIPINGNFNDFISGVTISNGDATGTFSSNMSGGGIFNYSYCALTLTDVVITGNTSTNGGGLYNDGTATLTNSKVIGNTSPNGGGILNGGTLTIINSTVSGNAASNGTGGGIVNRGGTVNIAGSTISGNTCDAQGGGIVNKDGVNGAGSLTLTNSTVSGNDATGLLSNGIGGISNNAGGNTLTLSNTTVTANTASGTGSGVAGIFNGSGSTANIKNSIVAQNTSTSMLHDLSGTFNSQGYNLIGKSAGTDGFTNGVNGDQVGTYATPVDPKLGMLTDNGGSTKTHALLVGSPAIDAGNSALTTDQRGQPRPVDNQTVANAAGGNASDMGAYEAHNLEVNSTADTDDGLCRSMGTGNGCTLREAINAANAELGAELITFAPALTSGGPATITLLTALADLSSDLTISGPGAALLTVRRSSAGGTPNFRIFTINSGRTISVTGVTIANGYVTGINNGGGVYNNGTLTMTDCNLYSNTAAYSSVFQGGSGGAIYNFGSLALNNCNIGGISVGQGNTADDQGGGIWHQSGTTLMIGGSITGNLGGGLGAVQGSVVLTNVAVTSNSARAAAGLNIQTFATITSCLIADNTATLNFGGGLYNSNANITVVNTTISGNKSAQDGGGIYVHNNGQMNIRNVTITDNRSDANNSGNEKGGGIENSLGTLTLTNTIVANNFRGGNPSTATDDIDGSIDPSSSFNLIGTGGAGGLTNGVNNNQVGVSNPGLLPLANNGGLTQTHALLNNSPALDAGYNAFVVNPPFSGPPFTDQRGVGFARIVDGPDADTTDTVDIGAFEAQVSVADIADQTINEDGSLSLPFNLGGAASITSVTATSSNAALVPNNPANISISGSGSSRTLQISPVANASGASTITVTVNGNNSQTMTDTFLLTVNPVNDAPSFTKGVDQTVNENSGAQTINNWASNISPGPANEAGQSVSFMVTNNSNAALFAAGPAISSTGTLTYTPAAGASGTAVITIALTDNGGTANGGADTSATQSFNITVLEGGALQFSSATFSVAEDAVHAVITVTRVGGSAGEAVVNYATSDSTATGGQDYTSASGTLTFPDGVTTQTFDVAIANDALDEPDETVNLTLTGPAGSGDLGTPINAVLTINDNDPSPNISIDDVAITEGDSGTVNANFTVTLSAPSGQTVTVNFATADGTAHTIPAPPGITPEGSDYFSHVGSLTFAPMETSKPVSVAVIGDFTFESNETFFVNLSAPTNATISDAQGTGTINNDDAQGGKITFSSPIFNVAEIAGSILISVDRKGDTSQAVNVDYETADLTADGRKDYTPTSGTLHFDAGQGGRVIEVLVTMDAFPEASELLQLTLSNPTGGAALGVWATTTLQIDNTPWSGPPANPIDDAGRFVRQHYHDFLNREAANDPDGLAFWTNQITECQQPGAICNAEVRRINVSAAFFLSIEFQETGYLVERIYKSAYGDSDGSSTLGGPTHAIKVPILKFNEFLSDSQQISSGVVVGAPNWEAQLENNKVAFTQDFVTRTRFISAYPLTTTPAEFVDTLFLKAGVTPAIDERTSIINEFGGAPTSGETAARARALRRVAENAALNQLEKNRAFVLIQYFGYLRRDPNAGPDTDYTGYDFWLTKLNDFNGNYIAAEMVKAFIASDEYRHRFGP